MHARVVMQELGAARIIGGDRGAWREALAHVPRAFCSPDTRVALRLRQTCRASACLVVLISSRLLTRLRDTRACLRVSAAADEWRPAMTGAR